MSLYDDGLVVDEPLIEVYRWCISGEKRAPTEGVSPNTTDTTNEKDDGYLKESYPTTLEMNGIYNNHGEWLYYLQNKVILNNNISDDYFEEMNAVGDEYEFISDEDYDELPDDDDKPPQHETLPWLDDRVKHRQSQLYTLLHDEYTAAIEVFAERLANPGAIAGCNIDMQSSGSFSMTAGSLTLHE